MLTSIFSRIKRLRERYSEMLGDFAWSLLADMLIITSQTASFFLLLRELDLEVYGGYVGLYGVIGPLGALSWSGLALLVMQLIVRHQDDKREVGRSTLTLAVGQAFVAGLLAFFISRAVVDTVEVRVIVALIVVDLFLNPMIMITAALRQAIVSFPAAAQVRIMLVLIRTLGLVGLWVAGELTLWALTTTWVVTLGVYFLYCMFVLWPKMGLVARFGPVSRDSFKTNMALSLPLSSSNLQKDGDKAVLNAYGFEADAGLYGAAFRLVFMAQMPIQSLNNALFHRFLSNDEEDMGQHVRRSYRFSIVSLALSVAVAAVIWVCAPILAQDWLLGDKFAPAVSILRWLLIFLPLTALSRAPLNGLLGLNATGIRAFIVISAAAVSFALYMVLIPSMSWQGAVWGTVIGELYLAIAGWWALIRWERSADAAAAAKAADRLANGVDGDDEPTEGAEPATQGAR